MQNNFAQANKRLVFKLIPREDGKKICKELKKMRKALADANGIEYEITECYAEGACAGTCPACDIELMKIQHELGKIPVEKRVYPEFVIIKTSEIAVQNVEIKQLCRPAMERVSGQDALKHTPFWEKDDEPEIDGGTTFLDMGSVEIPWDDEDELPFA